MLSSVLQGGTSARAGRGTACSGVTTTHEQHNVAPTPRGDSSWEATSALSQLAGCRDVLTNLENGGQRWEASFPSSSSSKGAEQTRFQMLLPHCVGPEATLLLCAQQNPAAEQMGQKGPPKVSPKQCFG